MIRWTLIFAGSLLFAAAAMGQEEDGTLEVRREMLAKSNAIRTQRGLKPHRENASLMAAAQDHAQYMARTRTFGHYSNGGPAGRAARHGFDAGVLENIGYGYATTDAMFVVWTNSGGHRANMLSGTTDAGFGWAIGGNGTPYWVAVYGTPPAEPTEDKPDDTSTDTLPQWRPRRGPLDWIRRR